MGSGAATASVVRSHTPHVTGNLVPAGFFKQPMAVTIIELERGAVIFSWSPAGPREFGLD
jgi:hypothetical protein